MLKMEKPHAHDENEQPCTMQKGQLCSGQNRNVGLKMLKLYIMLKTHNQNEGTESTNVILKIRTQMQ